MGTASAAGLGRLSLPLAERGAVVGIEKRVARRVIFSRRDARTSMLRRTSGGHGMRLLRSWRLGLGAALALSVSLAYATDPVPVAAYPECNRKPTPADLEGAKGAHKAASQFYDRGDYDKAIRYWNDAYSFDCTAHSVLINIANAYEKKGEKPAAIIALETYLKRSGSDPTIEEKIKNLRQSLQPYPTPTTSGAPQVTATAAPTAPPTAQPTVTPTAAPAVPPTPTHERPFGPAPWVVVGGGAAVAGVGAVLVAMGTSTLSDLESPSKCGPKHSACTTLSQVTQGNNARVMTGGGIAALAGGAAILGSGLVWQLMFNKPREVTEPATTPKSAASVRVLPAVGPTAVGISVSGAF
jgi:hypothetical protein